MCSLQRSLLFFLSLLNFKSTSTQSKRIASRQKSEWIQNKSCIIALLHYCCHLYAKKNYIEYAERRWKKRILKIRKENFLISLEFHYCCKVFTLFSHFVCIDRTLHFPNIEMKRKRKKTEDTFFLIFPVTEYQKHATSIVVKFNGNTRGNEPIFQLENQWARLTVTMNFHWSHFT